MTQGTVANNNTNSVFFILCSLSDYVEPGSAYTGMITPEYFTAIFANGLLS